MKLNSEYKPKDCSDLQDVKAGIERLYDLFEESGLKEIPQNVKTRLGAYQRFLEDSNSIYEDSEFVCYVYFLELKCGLV